jgi:hypothetical protein
MSNIPVPSQVLQEIVEKTNSAKGMFSQKVFKDILRFLIGTFGKIHYIDRNNNSINVKCFHANQERAVARATVGDNITLPVITISEDTTAEGTNRRRYGTMLVHEKYWHKRQQRAIRTLSMAPTPVDITYTINIWTKYKEDMDQIREYIFLLFNPDLEVQLKSNNVTKSFIATESDVEQEEAPDREDRILKKSIQITVETYIPSPKFLYTSTGKIEKLNYQIGGLGDSVQVVSSDNTQVCHDMSCTCEECLLPLVLISGEDTGIPLDCDGISVIVDGTLGS